MVKNARIKRIRISDKKYRLLRRCFLTDTTASQAAIITNVNRNTANRYYNFFRDLIVDAEIKERRRYGIKNGAEIDESYFGPRRVRGKRGRKVYTEIVPAATKRALLPIIRSTVKSGSDIYSDGWKSYDALDQRQAKQVQWSTQETV